ncbi:MAG: condensation domain protein, partial [Bryobacterales bacterium]|nr:condensation domain protein [Bryobacterales bacterium]
MSRRKLSHLEHIADFNIACFVRLEGSVSPEQLRSALDRMQRKHPALRALIRDEPDGLYYEADSAPEIPLRIVRRTAEDDYRREREAELNSDFAFDEPQLRVVWLRSELETDLLFTTSHRICDLMSILIVVKETLRALHSSEELIPYQAITTQDISGGYAPAKPWNGKLTVWLLNWVLRLLPSSRPAPQNKEHLAEWRASRSFSDSLRQRCKTEGVSVHSAFLVALDRALFAVFGKRSPRWITCPIDLRRGRLPGLKDDMLFYGGGNFKVRTGRGRDRDFWAAARAINDEMRGQIEREVQEVPGR